MGFGPSWGFRLVPESSSLVLFYSTYANDFTVPDDNPAELTSKYAFTYVIGSAVALCTT